MDHFRRAADVSTKPFIYLSAGVSNRRVHRSARARGRGGNAILGRALRTRDMEGRHRRLRQAGRRGVPDWLEDEGVKNINNVNERLKAAHPWFEFYGAKSADALA